MKRDSLRIVVELMSAFAHETGLSSGKPPVRYLWTDAFAVCNFLGLYRKTGDEKYRHLALRLVDQVHAILGSHREDDARKGLISGLSGQEGRMHPVTGGLRIGKMMNERKPSDPYDERLEWDRDGQYYHYLTKWMHALNRVSITTGEPIYGRWAMELAKTVHARFTYEPPSGGPKRMYWKMSIDLSRPLVTSMGHHDPLDGLITYTQLQVYARRHLKDSSFPDLSAEIGEMANICQGRNWVTEDPLGIGDLLSGACRIAQLTADGNIERSGLLAVLLDSGLAGLQSYEESRPLELPAAYRLPFRELGLSIGLHAAEKIQALTDRYQDLYTDNKRLQSLLAQVTEYAPLAESIEIFWLGHAGRETAGWTGHRDINMVMLATSLAPDGYLGP